MKPSKWIDRKFNFQQQEENLMPYILERLMGTPARLEEKTKQIPFEKLTLKTDNKWSIKENIGHLTDLEELWQLRLNDILEDKLMMSPWETSNEKTELANHNATSLPQLLFEFRIERAQTVQQLVALKEADVFKSALHPRLKIPMRLMDLFQFVADHDDQHLAVISHLSRSRQF